MQRLTIFEISSLLIFAVSTAIGQTQVSLPATKGAIPVFALFNSDPHNAVSRAQSSVFVTFRSLAASRLLLKILAVPMAPDARRDSAIGHAN